MAIFETIDSTDLGRNTAIGLLEQLLLISSAAKVLDIKSSSLKEIIRSFSIIAVLFGTIFTVFAKY